MTPHVPIERMAAPCSAHWPWYDVVGWTLAIGMLVALVLGFVYG